MKYSYRCTRCGRGVGEMKNGISAAAHLEICFPQGVNFVDYVECALCDFVGLKITQHVKIVHGLTKDEYQSKHGRLICENSSRSYGSTGNYDWIKRARDKGEDLTERFAATGPAKSAGILASQKAIAARKRNMSELNKRPERRARSSEVAKETSKRPEIIERRTQNLREWRSQHFEDFYEKCVMPMIGALEKLNGDIHQTTPEKVLQNLLSGIEGYDFKYSQCVKSNHFSSLSKRKQVDFGDKSRRVYVEFDGVRHFRDFNGSLKKIREQDDALDSHIIEHGWTLLRISYDQFTGKKFSETCIKSLFELLSNPKPGVFRIGKEYEVKHGENR